MPKKKEDKQENKPTLTQKVGQFLRGYANIMMNGARNDRIASWIVVLCLFIFLVVNPIYSASPLKPRHVDTDVFIQQVREKNIEEMHINLDDRSVAGSFKEPIDGIVRFISVAPDESEEFAILYLAEDSGVPYDFTKPSMLVSVLINLASTLLPIVILVASFSFLLEDGGLGQIMSNGPAEKELKPVSSESTFDDICGIPEAIEEVSELVSFLKNPEFYREAGAQIPRGILLAGPSGVGKTALARALAGEANVPFLSTSGADFIEMYVGLGAKRVRKLFKTAREYQPCIVFIDEIDAVGANRDGLATHGTDEHIQTMNALLSEMDGFENDSTVIVIAATNRANALDPALMRPGRFDRIITVNAPAKDGRKEILQHYAVGRPFAEPVDFDLLAAHTYGFSGAQLESVMNQAATLAARRASQNGELHPMITNDDLEEGIARVMSGPAMKSHRMSDEEKRQVAYHEAGHAIVQHVLPNCDSVQKISIVSRNIPSVGVAMGYVQTYSEDDTYVTTIAKCEDEIAGFLAGRCAERRFCGIQSAGASDDFKKASTLAYRMVNEFAFDIFDGSTMLRTEIKKDGIIVSGPSRLDEIDRKAEDILKRQMKRAESIIEEHSDAIERIVAVLLDKEQIDGNMLADIIDGRG